MILPFGSGMFFLKRSCETCSRLFCCCSRQHRHYRCCWFFSTFSIGSQIYAPHTSYTSSLSLIHRVEFSLLLKRASDFILRCSEWWPRNSITPHSICVQWTIFFSKFVSRFTYPNQLHAQRIIIREHIKKLYACTSKRSECVFICINCRCVVCECIILRIHLICTVRGTIPLPPDLTLHSLFHTTSHLLWTWWN